MAKTTNQPKQKVLTEQDMQIIKSDPVGLADYVVRTKVKDARKTAIIVALVFSCASFIAGGIMGMVISKNSIPNNTVTVQVGETPSAPAEPVTDAEQAE